MRLSAFVAIIFLFVVMVEPAPADRPKRPDACFSASEQVIKKGESTVLSWNTANATAVTVGTDKRFYTHRNWVGIKYPNWEQLNPAFPCCGSMIVTPEVTTTYYLIAREREIDINKNGKADGIRHATRRCVTIKVIE